MVIQKITIEKMKDETGSAAIEDFVRSKPKMYSILVEDNSEYKKAKGLKWNVASTISHKKYKDVLLNNKCITHSMNRIQNKVYRIGTFEITKFHCLALMTKYIFQAIDTLD